MNRVLSAPTVVSLEITESCNVQCRHCYNFWRDQETKGLSLQKNTLEKLFDLFVDAGVFHVVFTGGEPFLNFDILECGLKKARDNNISVSCNSNLMLATKDKLKRLKDAGLDHILTSLNSFDPAVNDYMAHSKGAFEKIINGIKLTVDEGIRVSVNTIISQINKNHVYQTGKLAHELGCQKIFGTRTVPTVCKKNEKYNEFQLQHADVYNVLNQLLTLKQETGIMIGTLVSYPLCLLGNLEKYIDFVGRGCPGQSGHFMSINVNGNTHACVHQSQHYGNVLVDGIFKPFRKMQIWYNEGLRYAGCRGCTYIDICRSGCRMSAHAASGRHDGQDPLMTTQEKIVKPFKIVHDDSIYDIINRGARFVVPSRIRFRKENGFYLMNIRWANTVAVSEETGAFLIQYHQSGKKFSIEDFGLEKVEQLAELFSKEAVESDQIRNNDLRKKMGFNIVELS